MKYLSKRKLVWAGFSLLLVFIGLQFVKKPIENPPVTSAIQVPDSVQVILIKSCFNCHSNSTRLSWYDRIAPASWIVSDHVLEARRVINFSEWDRLTKDQQKAALFESLNQMQFNAMPLNQYILFHPSSKPDPEDILIFKNYLSSLTVPVLPDSAGWAHLNNQFAIWMNGTGGKPEVKPSLNGIPFDPEFKNWVAISSTERFDNGTLRVIVGNETAANAVKTHHTNPWPDNSILVKIAWYELADSAGNFFPGAFKQVEFMIKDKNKYARTDGWGFARWVNGLKLEPYGKDKSFASECANCHQPMKKNDFVFTEPVDLNLNKALEGQIISSSVSRSDRTMAILYGNGIAVDFARTHSDNNYPRGSELTKVAWHQKEDEHWYGARIPGKISSVETIQITDSSANRGDSSNKLILNQRASVMP